jgi:transcriptional regulator with XRE-family HTH domain
MMSTNTFFCVFKTHFVFDIDGRFLYYYHSLLMKVEPIYKSIGAIIRGKRRGRNLSQEKLSARLGIKRATLANIETGRQRILAHMLYAFAEALEIKPADLLPPLPSAMDWTDLSFSSSDDLKPQQKQQIADLIGQVKKTAVSEKEESDGKSEKDLPRN